MITCQRTEVSKDFNEFFVEFGLGAMKNVIEWIMREKFLLGTFDDLTVIKKYSGIEGC